MKIAYCDCCERKIGEYEKIYSLEIKWGRESEFILDDVCEDCYGQFKNIIENAKRLREGL